MGKPFTVNTTRFSPYAAWRFLVYFGTDTTPVAGVSKISPLKRTSTPIEYKDGNNAITFKSVGRTSYDAVTLDRGVTFDRDFETWANAAQVLKSGVAATSLKDLRRDIRIELLNEAGQPVQRYLIHRCWVSEFTVLSELDAGGNGVAMEHIKLENEGWEHDLTLTEQQET